MQGWPNASSPRILRVAVCANRRAFAEMGDWFERALLLVISPADCLARRGTGRKRCGNAAPEVSPRGLLLSA